MFKGSISVISMVVICDAIIIIEYDRRTSELTNAPLHMTQDVNSTEKNGPLDLDLYLDIPVKHFFSLDLLLPGPYASPVPPCEAFSFPLFLSVDVRLAPMPRALLSDEVLEEVDVACLPIYVYVDVEVNVDVERH